ncbi:hypothetical protein AWC38_SpisGene18099 [Stylophora pistillata]|uniref:Uncharacterized protein n=1 Tax=Stylophora pistillata TaxID=50429 RepID=A0A2B4RML9_STYPI|nr:hypothetical protein AWC38_SpisGene18099 [Stylophora pistillata]
MERKVPGNDMQSGNRFSQEWMEGSKFLKTALTRSIGAFHVVTTGGKSDIKISNCTFEDIAANPMKSKLVQIATTNGNACASAYNRVWVNKKTGAISVLLNPDKPRSLGRVKSKGAQDTHPSWHCRNSSHVLFKNTRFEENLGIEVGAVHIRAHIRLLTFPVEDLSTWMKNRPPIIRTLAKQMLWFKKREEDRQEEELHVSDDDEHSESGFLENTYYFCQAAESLIVGFVEELVGKIPSIHFVISAYNFHVQSINQGLGCPFPGLTANPYRHPMANNAETLSLVTLSLFSIINLAKATPLSFGITIDGPDGAYMKGSNIVNVYVSLVGNDTKTCGSQSLPCQSIAQAVHRVVYGGNIYLDGRGTKKRPYSCKNDPNILMGHPGIFVNKSLTIRGLYSTPYVSCTGGFHFLMANGMQLTFTLEFSGITFQQTPLNCNDCQRITIHNCSFHNALRALAINIQNITDFYLEIQGNSTFRNNSQCINVLLLNNTKVKSRDVTIKIKDAVFEKNGVRRRYTETGVVKIRSVAGKGSCPVYIGIVCRKVKSSYNKGQFLDLNVSSAITNETFKDIEVHDNGNYQNKFKKIVQGLYFSKARETKAKFISMSFHDNPSVQCIVVQSDKAEIVIQDSSFERQLALPKSLGSCLSLVASISASVRIVNSNFYLNEAGTGGSLFINSPNGSLAIALTNVTFRQCKARKGCAIYVGRAPQGPSPGHWSPKTLQFSLQNVTVQQWRGKSHGGHCAAVDVLLSSGIIEVEGSRFTKTARTRGSEALRVVTTRGESDIKITNCTFEDTPANPLHSILVEILAGNGNAGMVTISDSLIVGNLTKKTALWISPKYQIKLVNITVISFRYGLQIRSGTPKNSSFPIGIYIDNCSFLDNVYDMMLFFPNPTSIQVTIRNTRFNTTDENFKWDESSYAIRLMIPALTHANFPKAVIQLDNDTFYRRPPSYIVLYFEGLKTVTIKRSSFRYCRVSAYKREWVNLKTGLSYETDAGAISILFNPDKPRTLGCVKSGSTQDTHPSWSYGSHVIFENTKFEENIGIEVGAVHISNGFTIFRRCVFRDNFGVRRSGHVHSAYGTGRVEFQHCSFLKTKESALNGSQFDKGVFLYSESGGPLIFENTSMTSLKFNRSTYPIVDISSGGFVHIDEKSIMKCNEGEDLILENGTHFQYTERNKSICVLNITVLKYSCKSCHPGYYSLKRGVSKGLVVTSTTECHPCPFGATCIENNIAAKPNFWGYRTLGHSSMLKLIACPENYCPSISSTNYSSCRGNRNGTLCGQCAEGFTETLLSTECRKSTKCNDYSVWVATIFLTLIFALYLLVKPPIIRTLEKQILWFKKREEDRPEEELHVNDGDEQSDSGFLEITFYFYQAAETLIVGSVEELVGKIPFIHFVISAYNFHVQSINQGLGCPFPGLTAVTKELFLSGTVFLTMANLVLIYAVHYAFNVLMGNEKPSLIRYMAVVMEVLLLGYERLAETALKLMNCVPTGSGKRLLFIDANVPCMQWWQYLLLAYIFVFLVPFIVVLYWGSFKLYRSSITAGEFVAASMIPLPFLIYWLVKGILKTRGEESSSQQVVITEVSDILHGPFRPPTDIDNGTLYWESVLIGRRLILLACRAFITDVMLRMVFLSAACLLITLHHVLKNPYRHPMANNAETLSLVTLSLIAIINLAKATPLSFGITTDGPSGAYLKGMEWFEVCALAFVPAIVSVLITFAIFSQLARFALFVIEQFLRCCLKLRIYPCNTDQEERPLLNSVEQNLN